MSVPTGLCSLIMPSNVSDGLLAGFVGPYPDRFFDRRNEHLPVANLPGLGRLHNGTDSALEKRIAKHDFNLDFWQEVDRVFASR